MAHARARSVVVEGLDNIMHEWKEAESQYASVVMTFYERIVSRRVQGERDPFDSPMSPESRDLRCPAAG